MRLIVLFVAFCIVDLTLLLILADYTSWQVALAEVLASGLLGAAVIRHGSSQLGGRILSRLVAGESPGDALADGAILFFAGILLILPGLISDVAGLLLLVPLVRRLVIAWLKRRLAAHVNAFQVRSAHSFVSDDPFDGKVILDGRVEDDD